MEMDPALRQMISAALVRMQARSPFFAALALFARFEATDRIPTAATDGRDVFVNPAFFTPLTPGEQEGLLAHEVLHAALLHPSRRHQRDPKLWNIAADIVINGMLIKEGYALPAGGLRDANLEALSTEEVYDRLLQQAKVIELPAALADLLEGAPGGAPGDQEGRGPAEREAMAKHWAAAQRQAQMGMEATVQGEMPAHLTREFGQLLTSQLDWRAYLWRYLVQTPTDYTGFDRRFVGRGVYLETLVGESVRVLVCVDTSSSVKPAHLAAFGGELRAILQAYPHLRCELFYADAKVYGPYPLTADTPLPPPVGGGGTDFRPFFEQAAAAQDGWTPLLAIYLTDGFGHFPATAPNFPVLWVVTPGGARLESFPFGEAVRLLLGG